MVSKLTMNSPCAHWVITPLPPVRRKLNLLGNQNQTGHQHDSRGLIRPISGRRRWRRSRRGILPLVHLFGVQQLRSCLLTTTAQPTFVGIHLSPEDSQLDFLIVDLEDGCCQGHSTPSVPSAKVRIVGITNYPCKG